VGDEHEWGNWGDEYEWGVEDDENDEDDEDMDDNENDEDNEDMDDDENDEDDEDMDDDENDEDNEDMDDEEDDENDEREEGDDENNESEDLILGVENHPIKRYRPSPPSPKRLPNEDGKYLNKGVIRFTHASFSDYLLDSSRSGPFHVNRQEYKNQLTIRSFALIMQLIQSWRQVTLMIPTLLIIHNHNRMSSITRVLHTTTWDYFTSRLPDRFSSSPKAVKEAIMTDINDFVQEFRRTSSDGAVGASFFPMRVLLEILQDCFNNLEVSFDIISVFATAVDLAEKKNLQKSASPNSYSAQSDLDDQIRAKFKILLDGYRKMFDQSFSKSKDLGDMLKFLPGVVVQNHLSIQGMAGLYRIKPDLLERLIKFTIEPLKPSPSPSHYILEGYLSTFLQDRDRSQPYYCDPMLQHISISRQFLSLLDGLGSSALDLQS
jgi:hypothetical protein